MNKRVIFAVLAVGVLAATGIGLFGYLTTPPSASIRIPEGSLSVSELLQKPAYDREVEVYGQVSLLGELFCPCFELTSSGKRVSVWYGLMVEDDGTERPSVSVEGIENGDWVTVTGELKMGGDLWASRIANMREAQIRDYEVKVGQRFSITLESNPTTGYSWELAEPLDESILKLVSSEYKTLATTFPPPPGTGGIEIWTFEALDRGTTEISLKYVRPWETDVPPARERTLVVIVN